IGFGKTLTGAVVGGGIGLAAAGLQGSLGHVGKRVFESKTLADWETKGNVAQKFLGKRLRTSAGGDDGKGGMAGSSFDLRKGAVGGALKTVSDVTGLNLGAQSRFLLKEEGGYEADLKRRDEKRKRRAEGLKIKEGETEKQHLNKMKEEHQDLVIKNGDEIDKKERLIKAAEAKRVRFRADLDILNKSGEDQNSEKYKATVKAARDASDE